MSNTDIWSNDLGRNPTRAELIDLAANLHGEIRRGDRRLICIPALQIGSDPELHFALSPKGIYYAKHFAHGGHGDHPFAGMTDAHRRMADYYVRLAQYAGLPAKKELRTGSKKGAITILDVAIPAKVNLGIEVQRVHLSVPKAKSRTTTSFKNGWTPYWFTPFQRLGSWWGHVPSLSTQTRCDWDTELPRPGSLSALGVRRVKAEHCTPSSPFPQCPRDPRQPFCNDWHYRMEPQGGLTVDEVVVQSAYGLIKPLQTVAGHVYLVPTEDFELYRTLTWKGTGEYNPGRDSKPRPPSKNDIHHCTNPHEFPDISCCWGINDTCACLECVDNETLPDQLEAIAYPRRCPGCDQMHTTKPCFPDCNVMTTVRSIHRRAGQ